MEYSIKIKKDPKLLFQKICAMSQNRLQINGDVFRGQFNGLFSGDYQLQGNIAKIVIRQKPRFISWKMVQKGIEYLGAPPSRLPYADMSNPLFK